MSPREDQERTDGPENRREDGMEDLLGDQPPKEDPAYPDDDLGDGESEPECGVEWGRPGAVGYRDRVVRSVEPVGHHYTHRYCYEGYGVFEAGAVVHGFCRAGR